MAASQLSVVYSEADDRQGAADEPTDALLADAWKTHRDAEAFGCLVVRYSGLVLGVCLRQCRTVEDAEDALAPYGDKSDILKAAARFVIERDK